jgi:nitrite reductase/ring-hydroxylating ferredoxin subunit
VPTAAAGLSDWSDTSGPERRVGLVHAVANTVALTCYSASLVARLLGRRKPGVALSLVGAGAVTVGGYLGGHLAYVQAVGVERKAFESGPRDWTTVMADGDLPEAQPRLVQAADTPVLLYRRGGVVHALADRCTHMGGPLHEGSFHDGCVTCPWHGSTFRLADGEVVRGPAAASQPTYQTRVADGTIQVRATPD